MRDLRKVWTWYRGYDDKLKIVSSDVKRETEKLLFITDRSLAFGCAAYLRKEDVGRVYFGSRREAIEAAINDATESITAAYKQISQCERERDLLKSMLEKCDA